MAQITIYLDPENERRLREAAADAGLSVSRWVAELIEERTRTQWPSVVRELAGAWQDFPDLEDLRDQEGKDLEREPL
ncbi:CopG family transcriptional regulator [Wenzhouxiangella sp. XN79A]|uniref:CopG family transcriptional regulator n=1 Tax=Wenzhouxiangella sp. XN79A TaxID=2724193 RepID=UPI00144A9EF1|nr:CopG family transcriptional regulator [Wenzhouxiangella sp. XN79A]NKI36183.1 CopG family transcriptional regulator [Wenzhouxiangella sp. XN79A]